MMMFLRLCASFLAASSQFTGFHHMSAFVGMAPFGVGNHLRYFFYRRTLRHCGSSVRFCQGCHFSYQNISIGDNVRIGYGSNYGLVDVGTVRLSVVDPL